MTDGIIQQAFDKHRQSALHMQLGLEYEELEQELIEKIKNARSFYTIKGSGIDTELTECRLLEQLIGDNQE